MSDTVSKAAEKVKDAVKQRIKTSVNARLVRWGLVWFIGFLVYSCTDTGSTTRNGLLWPYAVYVEINGKPLP